MKDQPPTGVPAVRIGVDVGGTFTDLFLIDDATGAFQVAKALTTPDDPSVGIARVLETALAAGRVSPQALGNVIHGTTLVTNAIIERKGARTALITTAGFRDMLDIAREHRYDMYDLKLVQPTPLVPRHLRYEVSERVLADGSVYRPLALAEVDAIVLELRRQQVGAVAICLLHSYRYPAHERAIAARLHALAPELRVTVSSDVAGEIREYERASTAVANVYVQDLIARYLERLERSLRDRGCTGHLLVMLSNGGLATVPTARRFPVRLIESGPAAGALAAAHAGLRSGRADLLSFDMGGTTAKACLIENGRPFTTSEFEVDRVYRFKRGSGLPIKAPAIEMIEIGAGGGSIARVDVFGLIKIGPDSAGAVPGPACYGRGGDQPTVTDADLVLGYLDPGYFLGGHLCLDRAAAERAIRETIAEPLGLGVVDAAWAMHQIVNESMASAARIHAVERGKDARRYPLFAFGGAGPVHAYRVAQLLGTREIIVPFAAGVGSTLGFLAAPLAFDFVRGAVGRLDRLDWTEIQRLYDEMDAEGRAILGEAQVPEHAITCRRTCDMRLAGQAHQIPIDVPDGPLSDQSAAVIGATFERSYLDRFKRAAPGVAVEALNWRLTVSGPSPSLSIRTDSGATPRRDADTPTKGRRPIYLPEAHGFVDVPVYDRYALQPGDAFPGPAVVEERESTAIVGPRGSVTVDDWQSLVIRLGQSGA